MSDSNKSRRNRKQVVVYMDSHLLSALDSFCLEKKSTRSRAIREALRSMIVEDGFRLSDCACLRCRRADEIPF